jgi:hypothetical protein
MLSSGSALRQAIGVNQRAELMNKPLGIFLIVLLAGALGSCNPRSTDPSGADAFHHTLDRLVELGCRVEYGPSVRSRVNSLAIAVGHPMDIRAVLECLRNVPGVEVVLKIADTKLELTGEVTLPSNVVEARFKDTRIVGSGTLALNASLEKLLLLHCQWDNAGCLDFSRASALRVLHVDGTVLGTTQVKGVTSLTAIRCLILDRDSVHLTKSIPPLHDLDTINVSNTEAEVQDVNRILSGAVDVQFVLLGWTPVDDSTLDALANRRILAEVDVSHTRVTSNGIKQLLESSRGGYYIVAIGIQLEEQVFDLAKKKGVHIRGGR